MIKRSLFFIIFCCSLFHAPLIKTSDFSPGKIACSAALAVSIGTFYLLKNEPMNGARDNALDLMILGGAAVGSGALVEGFDRLTQHKTSRIPNSRLVALGIVCVTPAFFMGWLKRQIR